jgi:hypothetical protein
MNLESSGNESKKGSGVWKGGAWGLKSVCSRCALNVSGWGVSRRCLSNYDAVKSLIA